MSYGSKGQQVKRENIRRVLKIIEDNPHVPFMTLEAIAGINIGLSPRTFGKYMQQLELVGKIKQTNEGYTLTGS